MFNLKDLGDMTKIASQAKDMQRQQDQKHNEQMALLKRIADTLDKIYNEVKKNK
ncbi:MAG: hypothetical protein ABIB11_04865 [Candidatus Omnitrophota bacterium]